MPPLLRASPALLGVLAIPLIAVLGARGAANLNPIQIENAKPGTTAWKIPLLADQHQLEGYASEVSVAPGDILHLHVSSSVGVRYQVRVYRLGWYAGTGGRLMPCRPCVVRAAGAQAIPQPDASTGQLALTWPVTDVVPIGRGWVSGYYLADLVALSGPNIGSGSWVPFIVSEPPSRDAAILVEASTNTWQAYNDWGGRSLYWNHTGVGDNHVSFDRPYSMQGAPVVGGPQANLPTAWEIPLARFLERFGYDVAYTTDSEIDANPAELLRHKLDMTTGHAEYWTKQIHDGWDAAERAGVNLAFMSANTAYWQMRYEDEGRTIVEYRNADNDPEPDPTLKTMLFSDLDRPECQLTGLQYKEIGYADYKAAGADRTPPDRWFAGTGFRPGADKVRDLVGYEYDGYNPQCSPARAQILFQSLRVNHPEGDAVRFRSPSGSLVFASGSIKFATRLDPLAGRADRRLIRFMQNALRDLLR